MNKVTRKGMNHPFFFYIATIFEICIVLTNKNKAAEKMLDVLRQLVVYSRFNFEAERTTNKCNKRLNLAFAVGKKAEQKF